MEKSRTQLFLMLATAAVVVGLEYALRPRDGRPTVKRNRAAMDACSEREGRVKLAA